MFFLICVSALWKVGFITSLRAGKEAQSCAKWPFCVPIYSHLLCSAFASRRLSYLARSTITWQKTKERAGLRKEESAPNLNPITVLGFPRGSQIFSLSLFCRKQFHVSSSSESGLKDKLRDFEITIRTRIYNQFIVTGKLTQNNLSLYNLTIL